MWRFALLFVTVSLSCTSASFSSSSSTSVHSVVINSWTEILFDASNCIHLRCEWRGEGEHCKPANSIPRDSRGWPFRFLNEEESDAELLARLKGAHPLNTFTIVKDVPLGEMCEERLLWCNAVSRFYSQTAYDEFLAYLRHPIRALRPKLQC